MDQLTGCTGCCEGSRLTCDRCSWFSCSAVCCASGWGCRLSVSRECWFGGLRCCRGCRIQRFEISTNWPWHSCCSLWNTATGQYFSKHRKIQMMTVRPLKRSSEIHNYNKLDKSKVQPYCILEQLKPRENKPQYVHTYTHTEESLEFAGQKPPQQRNDK